MQLILVFVLIGIVSTCRISINVNHEGICQRTSTNSLICVHDNYVDIGSNCREENDPCFLLINRRLIGRCITVANNRKVCIAETYIDPFSSECQ